MSEFLENESLAILARRLQSEMDIIDLSDLLVATDSELNEIAETLNLSMGQKLRFRKAIHNRRRMIEVDSFVLIICDGDIMSLIWNLMET